MTAIHVRRRLNGRVADPRPQLRRGDARHHTKREIRRPGRRHAVTAERSTTEPVWYGPNRIGLTGGSTVTPGAICRWSRTVSADSGRLETVSPQTFAKLVVTELAIRGELVPETLEQVSTIIEHFGRFLEAALNVRSIDEVTESHVRAFLGARTVRGHPPTDATRGTRRMALRMAFRVGRGAGLVAGDPSMDVDIGPNRSTRTRPLTDAEVERGRLFAVPSSSDRRRSTTWALSEATARSSEIGMVRARDVDLDRGTVRLPGTKRLDAREAPLTDWAASQLSRRLSRIEDPAEPVVGWRLADPKHVRASVSLAIKETFRAADLLQPGVRPESIAAWAGRRALEGGATIDEVARLLGLRSLDNAADLVRFAWREESRG
jgi:integrase